MYLRSGLPGNPIANAVTIVLGALALVAVFAFGFVILTGFLILGAIFVSFVSLRLWWLGRKLRRSGVEFESVNREHVSRPDEKGTVIDAEYRVIESRRRKP